MRWIAILAPVLAIGCATSAEPEAPKPGAAERIPPLREGSDWPKFLGPNGDSTSPETGIPTSWPKDGLKKLWDCELGLGYAPPSVVAGRLFHFDRFEDNARVSCRNAETGELVWKFEYPTTYEDFYGYDAGPRACPVVDGDRVYVYGVEGMLLCLAVADGKKLWDVDTRAKYHFHQNFFGVGSVPLVHGDLLIVAVGGSEKGPRPADLRDAKGNGTAIVAFDKKTGAEKYRFGNELASYSSPTIAKLGDKSVGLYFARGGLLGFDPAAGKELFHFPWRAKILESVNAANPLVVGDSVLLTECYGHGAAFVKIADNKPTEVWSDVARERFEQALLGHWCTPVRDGKVAYGCSGRHTEEAELRCINLADGEVLWREKRTTRCTLLKIDGHILSLGEYGELRLFKLNAEKYEQVAKWDSPDLSNPAWAPPVVSRGRLYLRGKGKLVCYDFKKPG